MQTSEAFKESDGTRYVVPDGRVLIGRSHQGDENGSTCYHHAALVVVTPEGEYRTTVGTGSWSEPQTESSSRFEAEEGHVLTGRWHQDDENGPTEYQSAPVTVHINDTEHPLSFQHGEWVTAEEPDHDVRAPEGQVLVGRSHQGNETEKTHYLFATPTV
ncbi:hypothetical protein [Streptomyces sp. ICBB 8177]|uniref:hypothetical protein n=1 Tax=Streptomyces sp. ICBB 8177 TaxID=563922 RepID=UPI0011B4FD11|nr:hypothetical protein [Streptomyces sp. ICBB 8177]